MIALLREANFSVADGRLVVLGKLWVDSRHAVLSIPIVGISHSADGL